MTGSEVVRQASTELHREIVEQPIYKVRCDGQNVKTGTFDDCMRLINLLRAGCDPGTGISLHRQSNGVWTNVGTWTTEGPDEVVTA